MAEFNGVTMTQNGLRLIELSQGMSKPLSFTKIMMGDGTPGTGEDITAYTALKNPKLTANITNIKSITSASTEARWAVYGAYSNSTLSEGFYIKEAGLYAKVEASNYDDKGWDGYAGEELLIGYVSAKEGKADWLPAASVAQETQEIVFYSSVGNASSVTAYVPEDSFVKDEDLTPNKLYEILHKYGNNFVPADVTNKGWGALGTFISYYTQKLLKNQPAQYGQLINICADKNNEATQIWLDQCSGKLAYRGGNGSASLNDAAFTYVATKDEAGIIDGDVSNANSWWVKLGGVIPLIIQGGKYDGDYRGSGGNSLTFPKKFSSKCLYISATRWYDATNRAAIIHIKSVSTSGATFGGAVNDSDGGAYYNTSGKYSWLAIGI